MNFQDIIDSFGGKTITTSITTSPVPAVHSDNTKYWVAGGILLLLLIIAFAIIMLTGDKKEKKEVTDINLLNNG